ncbi:MAG: MlaD family protein [Planctomycetota bacterium]
MNEEAADKKDSPDRSTRDSIPTANVRSKQPGLLASLAASYMWLLTIICLAVAVGLVWWSMPERGIQITIRFPEGHGLEAEDSVRFRGIEVGTVEKVQLNNALNGVNVTVNLLPFAEPLAREGSRFWIVRPELSLNQISGLETAVGHKYIGVLPGDPEGNWLVSFDGMANSPPDVSDGEGTEIILRGSDRHGINPGSPLSFRGIVVGRILSVDLSRDAKTVEARVRVYEPFTKLVTSHSKFWASSGLNFDLRWGSGLKVDVDSLETIVKGGVSMLTIQSGGQPVQPGQLFELAEKADDEWFELAQQTPVTDTENLRSALKMRSTWKQDGIIYGTVDKDASFVGTFIQRADNGFVVVPRDMSVPPEKANENTFGIRVVGAPIDLVEINVAADQEAEVVQLPINTNVLGRSIPFAENEIRIPKQPEKCLAVRMEGELNEPTFLHMPIEIDAINEDWSLKNFDGDRNVWHGAPVVSDTDGQLIGFLLVEERDAKIVPVWDGF